MRKGLVVGRLGLAQSRPLVEGVRDADANDRAQGRESRETLQLRSSSDTQQHYGCSEVEASRVRDRHAMILAIYHVILGHATSLFIPPAFVFPDICLHLLTLSSLSHLSASNVELWMLVCAVSIRRLPVRWPWNLDRFSRDLDPRLQERQDVQRPDRVGG